MNKSELIAAIAEKANINKTDAEKTLKATLESITETLQKGENIALIGFGTFSVTDRSARTGRNPQTGEELEIKAKKVAKFKPGKAIDELLNPQKPEPKKKGGGSCKKK